MLPTFCPPTIWTISLEFYRKPSILAADDFLGACCRKAMTPKKLWTLLFPQTWASPQGMPKRDRENPPDSPEFATQITSNCTEIMYMGKTGTIWQFFRALFSSTWRTLSPDALFTRIRDTRKHTESAAFSCFPC